ncbi:GPR endopeptidase [Lachnospiraceae bacterium ZAX-1]
MSQFQVRTDLALETREKFEEDNVEIKGVRIDENYIEESEIKITTVVIETENGAKSMGKPKGNYVTLEAPHMIEQDEGCHREISIQLAKVLHRLLRKNEVLHNKNKRKKLSVLVVGLGNREVTPDALGPRVVDNMLITRHVIKEYGKYAFGEEEVNQISSIVPGVMAQTGMESLEIIRGVIKETKPDCMIAVDALAARSTKRLSRTIQITDTGINPGSGVGNHRHGLCMESVGIPVIAIGIPTVVDAATIVNDTMNNLIQAMAESTHLNKLSGSLKSLDEAEKYDLIRELLSPNLNTMFVTPKDIDESIKRLSFTISEGLNIAFAGN